MAKQSLEWVGPIELGRDFREGIAHGTPLLPMSVHHTKVTRDYKAVLYYHWHEELELLFLTKGRARFQVEGEKVDLEAGEILLIRPNQAHSATALEPGDVEFYAVLIHFGFVAGLANDGANQKYIRPLYSSDPGYPLCIREGMEQHSQLLRLLHTVRDLYLEEEFGYELLLKSRVHELIYRLALCREKRHGARSRAEDFNTLRVKQVVQFIEKNFRRKITLSDAAREVNMSQGHFCRFFKEQVGMTLVEYLNNYRLSEAARQIRATDKRLTEIAMDCGFGNVNYFTTVFKRSFSCTPMEYRQRGGEAEEESASPDRA